MFDDEHGSGGHDGRNGSRGRGGSRGGKGGSTGGGAAGGEAIARLFDTLPPRSLEAEMALLGAMVIDPNVIPEVQTVVRQSDRFYSAAHGLIFDTLCTLYDQAGTVDLVQLLERLRGEDAVQRIGGEEYLVELAEQCPSAVNAPHYARIVADKAKLRRLIDAAGRVMREAHHAGDLAGEDLRIVLDEAEASIYEVSRKDDSSDPQGLGELLQKEMEAIEAAEGKGISGLPTGYLDLDKMLRGLQPGEMLVLAARPSMGKTALALNLIEQVSRGGRTPWDHGAGGERIGVLLFSLEMSKSSVTRRLMSAFSGLPGGRLRDGSKLGADDWQRLTHACNELSEIPIYIDDSPGLTVMQMRARSRRMNSQHGIGLIVIDYLQLLSAPSSARESRQVEVAAISRQIKALARELNVPVVCLSQLNRGAEQREGNRPRMSDLRESGSIEQDADVIMLLHREEYYHSKNKEEWQAQNPDKVDLAEVIIAKQRNGPTGVVKLTWDESTTRFKNHVSRDEYTGDPEHGSSRYGGGSQRGYGAGRPEFGEPKPDQPRRGGAFAPGDQKGPVKNHRDGGGPDVDDLDTGAPFE